MGLCRFCPFLGFDVPSMSLYSFRKSLKMSVLKQKLDKAAEQFQIHNFREALECYEDCLSFAYRTDQSRGIIHNIMSAKGALLCILGEVDQAMGVLNEVLRSDPNHYLALMRRSQAYKKKGKFNRSLKDLESIATFCPDNLQIAAMKIEIENLKSKNKSQDSSQESDSEEEYDQTLQLNFSNLKKIDRKSCSIMIDPLKRKSRVTISGDTAFVYEQQAIEVDKSQNSTSISGEQVKEKYLKTFRQIQMMTEEVPVKATNIVVKNTGRSKSILKNRFNPSIIVPEMEDRMAKYGGRESKLIERLKNIDGKMISSNHSLEPGSSKQVQFKKSTFASQGKPEGVEINVQKPVANKKGPRKSCLKRSSFENIEKQVKQRAPRRSKFQTMSRNSIDGAVIKNRKSILVDEIKQNKQKDQDSDGGSSYNIFGSGQQLVLSKQLTQQLGLGRAKQPGEAVKQKGQRGKSILKKNSILSKQGSLLQKPQDVKDISPPAKKAKKSVMFTKSRFAD